ncbi:hydrolase, TatD family protein [Candidatus Mycoplasma haematolamae str. Purdue]|uniref:Hydrolase, TatD family protein n=1 Tax=Mycoplasma haematolamae (strain Purdue) TaxID=1212765 RepID=I7B9P0_MYCHA|nr:TatD family hydrolase [Candidatus Mycoplasma haematolamae]AFO51965.1 hydrolase, TatD family protein [Candidatus Mycoplasma haematolamae str. Purdue]
MNKDRRIFETHIHFSSDAFKDDFERYISLEPAFWYLNVATSLEESHLVIDQANNRQNVFCAIGVHPLYLAEEGKTVDSAVEELERLIEKHRDKVVAIGEIGLDFYRVSREEALEIQLIWLKKQIEIAIKHDLVVVFHIRNACKDALDLLREYPKLRGIIHSFDGSKQELREALELPGDFVISFSPLVFRNPDKFREIVPLVPIDKLLVESDSPYLGITQSICRSIVRVIAEWRGISFEEVRRQTFENSLRVFKIKLPS